MPPFGSFPPARNMRLLVEAAVQHAIDDPVLLALQVSRRLPFAARLALGRTLARAAGRLGPRTDAVHALGSLMAGDEDDAVRRTRDALARARPGRLAAEIAVQLDRADLVPARAPAATRARGAWARGEISEALGVLEGAGEGRSAYARRLRSELDLLQVGHALAVPTSQEPATAPAGSPSRAAGERLRVLHVLTNSLPHTQSGYSLRSHRVLTAQRDRGIDVLAVTRTGYPVMLGKPFARTTDVIDGIEYRRVLPPRLGRTQEERLQVEVDAVLAAVEEFRPHVLHTTTNYLNALVAQEVSRRTGLPWAFEVRGFMEQTWVASRRTDAARTAATRSERACLTAAREAELACTADAVVTLSATMREELVRRGVEPARITVVPNGVEQSLFDHHMDVVAARAQVGIDRMPQFGSGALLVGAVSALVDYEGFDVLLRAVAHLVHDGAAPTELRARLAVLLVGDGVARPGLELLADELGIADRVLMPGRVPREEAPVWVQALDLVCVPRLDREVARAVTPQKPVEAMALGRPVIMSDLPALREVAGARGDDGLDALVPPEDPAALARAIASLAMAPHDGDRPRTGSPLVADRSWTSLVVRYEALYRQVTGMPQEVGSHGE